MKNIKKGFTLIELMIVVAIIGILAAIAIPKFADLINKSKEGATKGALSSIRSAIQVYYGDNEGWFPADTLGVLTVQSKYINSISVAKLPGTNHADSNAVLAVVTSTYTGAGLGQDVGGWAYFNNPLTPNVWGNFIVNCIHEDIKGTSDTAVYTPWTSF